MDAIGLVPKPPAGFKQFEPPQPAAIGLGRIYAKFLFGYSDGVRVIWIADSSASPVKVVRITVWLYETPAFAAQAGRSMTGGGVETALRGQSVARVSAMDDGEASVWSRGETKFTSLDRVINQAIVGCEIASATNVEALPQVLDWHRQIERALPPAGASARMSRRARQLTIGLAAGFIIALVSVVLAATLDLPYEAFVGVGLVALVYWLSVRPRIFRSRRMRRWLTQGDQTGDVKRALASLGVALPASD